MNFDEEVAEKLNTLLSMQQELMELMKAMDTKRMLPDEYAKEDLWMDSYEVKALLHIGDLTLRRRRQERVFVAKKIGKKWFYLRSTVQ